MAGIEWRGVSSDEMVREIEESVRKHRENKYAFQIGLKDLDFDVDEEQLKVLGLSIPFGSLDQAEGALQARALTPTKFLEHDDTQHQVLAFDHKAVGYSGFMDCVTHSLVLTDQGLFEVGRYPAVSLSRHSRYWGWFLHRRLATPDEVNELMESQGISSEQFVDQVYPAFTQG